MSLKRLAIVAGIVASAGGGAGWYSTRPDTLSRVIDGDTIVINGATHVRLWGIDAPELDQTCDRSNPAFAGPIKWDCGKAARAYLQSFFKSDKSLTCDKKSTDTYGRTVAICYTVSQGQKHDIGKSLVAAGMAVDYVEYSHHFYEAQQTYAQHHKVGVWSGDFMMPWDWRHKQH